MSVSVVEATRRDLAAFAAVKAGLDETSLAAAALELAAQLDDPGTRPTAKAMCARELREHMTQLREMLPEEERPSRLTDLRSRSRVDSRSSSHADGQSKPKPAVASA